VNATQIRDENLAGTDAKQRLSEDILKRLMHAKGIKSIAELSRRTRERGSYVSKSTIFRLISGEVQPTLRVGRALARELDTTVETLFAKDR